MKENVVVVKSTELALEIISFCEVLEAKRKFVVGKQLLRSGTSVGANIREAQHAESRADFIHKLKIAAKSWKKPNTGWNFVKRLLRILQSPNWDQ